MVRVYFSPKSPQTQTPKLSSLKFRAKKFRARFFCCAPHIHTTKPTTNTKTNNNKKHTQQWQHPLSLPASLTGEVRPHDALASSHLHPLVLEGGLNEGDDAECGYGRDRADVGERKAWELFDRRPRRRRRPRCPRRRSVIAIAAANIIVAVMLLRCPRRCHVASLSPSLPSCRRHHCCRVIAAVAALIAIALSMLRRRYWCCCGVRCSVAVAIIIASFLPQPSPRRHRRRYRLCVSAVAAASSSPPLSVLKSTISISVVSSSLLCPL